jgi:hypothetical protein
MKLANTAWLGLVSAAAIVAMFLDFATFTSTEESAGIDVETTASIPASEPSVDVPTFVISGPGGGTKCKAFPAENGVPGHNALTIDSSCAGLYPPLANARIWHNNGDGTIDLADNSGRTIVEFSPGDGLAYISVEPRSVILSMSAVGVNSF